MEAAGRNPGPAAEKPDPDPDPDPDSATLHPGYELHTSLNLTARSGRRP